MRYAKLERIVKTYYDALEEGKVLGRKCPCCGHVEFPPYLACNNCGNLETEWVDLTNARAHITQVLPPLNVFPENDFQDANDGFVAVCVQIENADPYVTSMVHVGRNAYDRIHDNMENIIVKPYIAQGADTKICLWVDENYKEKPKKQEEAKAVSENASGAAPVREQTAALAADADDDITKAVIAAAAEGYDTDEAGITLATDIREDLSPESMKMIVMLSGIEEALDITIDITEAGELNTIADFVNLVRKKLGVGGTVSAAAAPAEADKPAAGGEVKDEIAKVVIEAAADAYDVDASRITLATDIRDDLSPESMKMIVMLSNIEDALNITIEITEAGELNTISEFVEKVKQKM